MWVNVKQVNNTRYMTYIYKGIIVALLLFVAMMDCHSQLPEKGDYRSRVGIKAPGQVQSLMSAVFERPPYKDPFAPLDSAWYMDFYEKFKKLTDYAPYADYAFYSGAFSETQTYIDQNKKAQFVPDGTSIYERLIEAMPNTAMKMVVVEDILALGRKFIDNLDSVNVVRNNRDATVKAADDTLSLPVAMTKYAHLYYKYAGNPKYYPAHLYDKVQARENYRKAFRMLVDNNIDPGSELDAFYVREYYLACEELYNSDRERYYEQFLNDYLELVEVCDNLLIRYGDVHDAINKDKELYQSYNSITNGVDIKFRGDTIIRGQYMEFYDTIPYGIKPLFQASGAASSEALRKYFGPRLIENEGNEKFLNSSIHFMYENGFTRDSLFFKYCETSYKIRPTYENCIGYASFIPSDSLGRKMKIDCYLKALDFPSSEVEKLLIRFSIAQSLFTPRPSYRSETDDSTSKPTNYGFNTNQYKEWEADTETCNTQLDMVLQGMDLLLNHPTKLEIRKIPAKAYYMKGINLLIPAVRMFKTEMIDKAIDCFLVSQKMNIDQSKPINGRKVNVVSQIETAKKYKEAIIKVLKEQRNNRKLQQEYEEYMRKKKAEEDFWNQR